MELPLLQTLALAGVVGLVTVLLLAFLLRPSRYAHSDAPTTPSQLPGARKNVSVQIIVLGDIGRSPRMQYHAISLASKGAQVTLVGYRESELHPELDANPRVTVLSLSPPPRLLRLVPFLIGGPLKALHQAWNLFTTLAYRADAAQWMLMQNPPAIPTLLITQAVCLLRRTKLVVDWHNYGWSILALRLGPSHPLVRISQVYEFLVSRRAHAHFAVTRSMARDLDARTSSKALTLYDRPAAHFQPLPDARRLDALVELETSYQIAQDIMNKRMRLVVSSTSWTPDEDFSILLDALVAYSARRLSQLPRLLVVITGKGPQKEHYIREINKLKKQGKLAHVDIITAWLSIKDYALLLSAADVGVCLHQSSSGLDLPMKVVDMFGAGLPVLAWNEYESFAELIKEGVNGRGFRSAAELEGLLVEVLGDDTKQLARLKEGALDESTRRWDDEWDPVAGKLFGVVD